MYTPRRSDLATFDLRCHNRLTETGMTPIDIALTFTGLAAQLIEVSQ